MVLKFTIIFEKALHNFFPKPLFHKWAQFHFAWNRAHHEVVYIIHFKWMMKRLNNGKCVVINISHATASAKFIKYAVVFLELPNAPLEWGHHPLLKFFLFLFLLSFLHVDLKFELLHLMSRPLSNLRPLCLINTS